MDSQSIPRLIKSYLNVEALLEAEPGLTNKDITTLFQKLEDAFGTNTSSNRTHGKQLKLYTDGAARGNPGPAAIGCVILDSNDNILLESGKAIGQTTNNTAEYQALLYGLELVQQLKPESVAVFSDSELMVNQINGAYKTRENHLKKLKLEAEKHLKALNHYTIQAIPRSQNKIADSLANKALDAQK